MKSFSFYLYLVLLCIPLSGCVGMGGEEITLSHDPLALPSQRFAEKIAIQKPADDTRINKVRIGRATFTVFAITSGSITTTTPVTDQVVDQVKDALASLGYQVDFIKPQEYAVNQMKDALNSLGYQVNLDKPENDHAVTRKKPSLKLKVALNYINFKNYNWLFPIVPTWGDIKLTLTLEGLHNNKLFEKTYEGGDHSLCLSGHCAFTNATREAMTELLNKVIKDFSSSPVRELITAEYNSIKPDDTGVKEPEVINRGDGDSNGSISGASQ